MPRLIDPLHQIKEKYHHHLTMAQAGAIITTMAVVVREIVAGVITVRAIILLAVAGAMKMVGGIGNENKGGGNMKVFLGGAGNESTWRNQIIPMLNIDYFNPVVDSNSG